MQSGQYEPVNNDNAIAGAKYGFRLARSRRSINSTRPIGSCRSTRTSSRDFNVALHARTTRRSKKIFSDENKEINRFTRSRQR